MATGSGQATGAVSQDLFGSDNRNVFLTRLRVMIGNVSEDSEFARDWILLEHLRNGLETWADQLEYKRDTRTITLTAGVQEYNLPADFMLMVWVEHNNIMLTPRTTFEWELRGTDWRDVDDDTPTEYAVEGRKFILTPAPDADAITDSAVADYRMIISPGGLDSQGASWLSDADTRLALMYAALEWCESNPDHPQHPETHGNNARAASLLRRIGEALPPAKKRQHEPIEDHAGSMQMTTYRSGMAR